MQTNFKCGVCEKIVSWNKELKCSNCEKMEKEKITEEEVAESKPEDETPKEEG